ncbi:unnamed protein product, partial [Protopolystoma xenopodis]
MISPTRSERAVNRRDIPGSGYLATAVGGSRFLGGTIPGTLAGNSARPSSNIGVGDVESWLELSRMGEALCRRARNPFDLSSVNVTSNANSSHCDSSGSRGPRYGQAGRLHVGEGKRSGGGKGNQSRLRTGATSNIASRISDAHSPNDVDSLLGERSLFVSSDSGCGDSNNSSSSGSSSIAGGSGNGTSWSRGGLPHGNPSSGLGRWTAGNMVGSSASNPSVTSPLPAGAGNLPPRMLRKMAAAAASQAPVFTDTQLTTQQHQPKSLRPHGNAASVEESKHAFAGTSNGTSVNEVLASLSSGIDLFEASSYLNIIFFIPYIFLQLTKAYTFPDVPPVS